MFKEKLFEQYISKERKSLISGPFGSDISAKFFVDCGIPVIRGNNLSTGFEKFIDDGFAYITQEKADELNAYAVCDDLIFTAVGTLGQVGIIPKESNFERYIISNKQIRVRLDTSKLDPLFAFYWFSSPWMVSTIKTRNVGSTVPLINLSIIKKLPLRIPEKINEQKSIAKVLSDLDAKIELNNKINQELEAMAKTLYDYWFVQFDFPDVNGKPYKSSGGKMVYNAELKREIPEGWGVEKVSNCCKIVDCLHSKKPEFHFEAEGYYLLQLENLKDDGLIDLSNKYYISKNDYTNWTSRIEVKENDIVITNAGRVGATAQIPENLVTGIGRNITAIRPISISPTYLFLAFRGLDMKRQIAWNTDQGAFFTSLNVKGIKLLYVLRPPKVVEASFEKNVLAIRKKRELFQSQNQHLTALRDWLLPMLMNGQVTVKEAEEKLSMAAEPSVKYGS